MLWNICNRVKLFRQISSCRVPNVGKRVWSPVWKGSSPQGNRSAVRTFTSGNGGGNDGSQGNVQDNGSSNSTDDTSSGPVAYVRINGNNITVPKHTTILEACNMQGIYVPTLCNHPNLPAVGVCRMCVVDVAVHRGGVESTLTPPVLKPACKTELVSGMVIDTDSERVRDSIVHNLELMKANHPNDCMTCSASGNCEFQDLMYRYNVEDKDERTWKIPKLREFRHEWDDNSSDAVSRAMDKCIKCGRCVRACSVLQGMNILGFTRRGGRELPSTMFDMPLDMTQCIECGQCSLYCPTGAITERPELQKVLHHIESRRYINIACTAPSVRVALGETFDMECGSTTTGQMVSGLKHLGFDYVFDTQYAADLTIMEEGTELLNRVKNGGVLPMFTSCCPGWINLVEKVYPELIPNLSTCRSPQGMMGSLVKSVFSKRLGVCPSDIRVTSIMPCTAKKAEAERKQLRTKVIGENGEEIDVRETDYVLTTRELGHMLKLQKVHLPSLEPSEFDNPLGTSTGASVVFGTTGGVMEAALRTAYEVYCGKPLENINFESVRGLAGIKSAVIPLTNPQGETLNLRVAIVHGTAQVRHLIEKLKNGELEFDFIEVMACKGGCIGGGGQPKSQDPMVLNKRMNSIYSLDEKKVIRKSHENPDVQLLYEEVLGRPNSEVSHKLLHTHYNDRSMLCIGNKKDTTPINNANTTTRPDRTPAVVDWCCKDYFYVSDHIDVGEPIPHIRPKVVALFGVQDDPASDNYQKALELYKLGYETVIINETIDKSHISHMKVYKQLRDIPLRYHSIDEHTDKNRMTNEDDNIGVDVAIVLPGADVEDSQMIQQLKEESDRLNIRVLWVQEGVDVPREASILKGLDVVTDKCILKEYQKRHQK